MGLQTVKITSGLDLSAYDKYMNSLRKAGFTLDEGHFYKAGSLVFVLPLDGEIHIGCGHYGSMYKVREVTPDFLVDSGVEAIRLAIENIKTIKAMDEIGREINLDLFNEVAQQR